MGNYNFEDLAMDNLGINKSHKADANVGNIPVREKDMSLEKLANTFRKLVTTAGTSFDTGLDSLSQSAGISGIAKSAEAVQSGDDYHNTADRSEDNNTSNHASERRDTRNDEGQYDNRDDIAPRHEDDRSPHARDARDRTNSENRDDSSSHNNSTDEQAPHNNDKSNNSSHSNNENEQSTPKADRENTQGQSQKDGDVDANSAHQATANSSNSIAQQAATAGANAGIDVGNSIIGAVSKGEAGANAGIDVGTSIIGAVAKGEAGKSDGTAKAGPNANLVDSGSVIANNGPTNHGPQTSTHTGPKANAVNASQNAIIQGQSEANIQASNAAQQQAQQIAKSLNPNDKVQINVTVDTASETLISKPNSNLIAGTVLAGADGKSTNKTGQQTLNGQVANGQAPSVAAVAQQVQAAQAQNQSQQNNNQSNHASGQAQSTTVSNAASATQATQSSGAALVGGGETVAGVAATTNGSTQQTQLTQQAQDAQANQKPALGPSVVDQVSVKIRKALQAGNDKISIQLKPAELGRVDVKMELTHDGRIMAVVTADSKDTLDLLRRDSNDLQKALENAGLQMDSGDMTFNLRGDENEMAGNGNLNSKRDIEDEGLTDAGLDDLILAQDIDVITDTRVDVRA
jgi:flagellar hook-length control protein FliK